MSELSRRDKERRGYQLVVVGSITGAFAVIGGVLALFGVIGAGFPFVAAVVAIVCWVMFRRLVRPS